MSTTALNGPDPGGHVSVPASVTPAAVLAKLTSRVWYGNGASGSCGRR